MAVRKNRDKKLEEEEEKGISSPPPTFFHWVFYANVSKYLCVYIYAQSVLDSEDVCVNIVDKRDKTMDTGFSIVFLLLICGAIHFWKCLYLKTVICRETNVH